MAPRSLGDPLKWAKVLWSLSSRLRAPPLPPPLFVRMRVGAERSEVALAWPSGLSRPRAPLVYLDLNQWIGLAKVHAGHPDGVRWKEAASVIRRAAQDWVVVLGLPLIWELTGIRRRAQRSDLACVIEELTGFASILPLHVLARLEFDASLSRFVERERRFAAVPLIGQGIGHSLGVRGGFVVRDPQGNDVTDQARLRAPVGSDEFDRRLAEAELQLNRSVIRGPETDEEEGALRRLGWEPSTVRDTVERRARQERDQAARLSKEPRWRRGRLRDVVAARYVALEMEEAREEIIDSQGLRVTDLFRDVDEARAFTDAMPAGDIWITLRTAKHRNADSTWTANDIFDIDALSVAAAYCDVVVTERHSAHVLRTASVEARHGTRLLTDLGQLARYATGG